jgi:type IV pilus assembly protein PilO
MNLSDINNLDIKDIANTSTPIKAVLLSILCIAVIATGWFLLWSGSLKQLDEKRNEEQSLRDTYKIKRSQAANYDEYKQRLKVIEDSISALLRQLPSRSEMDSLLADINQTGVARGLDFDLFKPGSESSADFYASMPVNIKVSGAYHDIGGFISDIAQLPRIVTLHDINLTPVDKNKTVTMEARIETYRYLDEKEIAEAKKAKSDKAKGDKKK